MNKPKQAGKAAHLCGYVFESCNGGKADRGGDLVTDIAANIVKESLGCVCVFRNVQDGSGVDDLAAHLSGGGIHNGQTGRESVSLVMMPQSTVASET